MEPRILSTCSLGHHDREVVAVLDDVELAGLVDAAEVHVVGERGAGDAADLDPERERLGVGLAAPHLEHPHPRLVGDREQRGRGVGHVHHDTPVPRVLLLVPTATYRAPDFVTAARALGIELVVGSEEPPAIGDRAVAVPLDDPEAAVDVIEALDDGRGVDAVVAVDDQGVVVAAAAGARLGFPHNPPDAVAATRDKRAMRRAARGRRGRPAGVRRLARRRSGIPCVVKPTGLAGQPRRDPLRRRRRSYDAAVARIRAFWDGPLIVERYVPGGEVAVEAILRAGALDDARGLRQARPARRPVLRGDDLRHAVAAAAPRSLADVEQLVARGATRSG